ncbi:MAG TPA: hypothetical protein VMZ51_08055 [Acidimicrobiales bacterium]|nr:hypothetical protein [Acidimicrobiales bacterium]
MTPRRQSKALVAYAETVDADLARELDTCPEMIQAHRELVARQATLDRPTWGGAIGLIEGGGDE